MKYLKKTLDAVGTRDFSLYCDTSLGKNIDELTVEDNKGTKNTWGYCSDIGDLVDKGLSQTQNILDCLKQSHVFVMSPTTTPEFLKVHDELRIAWKKKETKMISLPFEAIWVETGHAYFGINGRRCQGFYVCTDDDVTFEYFIAVPAALETFDTGDMKDGKLKLIYGKFNVEDVFKKLIKKGTENEGKEALFSQEIDCVIYMFVMLLESKLDQKHVMGQVQERHPIKVKTSKGKIRTKPQISNVTYIMPTKEYAKKHLGKRRDIVFTHKFKRRGHWRQFNGLGKNRKGERIIHGQTWVSEAIILKDRDDLVLIEKIRIIKQPKEV